MPSGVAAAGQSLLAADMPGRIEREVLPRLQRVERRFGRRRLNIGVAGKARVGKSTLLQSISGLDEEQIPTGDNLSVTAVRSRIFHSATQRRALLSFHDWESFRRDVLQPYYTRLGWGSVASSSRAFAAADLPAEDRSAEAATTLKGLRNRVDEMKSALDLYLSHLTGGEPREVGLDGLRKFVAYPTDAEVATGRPARLYLAVREAEIECPFPGMEVQQLGLIDLPGMGEIVAAGEDRHVAGLEDEVDVVLLVVKPPRVLEWDAECATTMDHIRAARCGAEPEDFALLVLNSGGASEGQRTALKGSIERGLRDESGSFRYRLLEVDAKDPGDVRERLTARVLGHLASRLPTMDAAALRYAESGVAGVQSDAAALLASVERALSEQVPATTPSQLLVYKKAKALLGQLAVALRAQVNAHYEAARVASAEDPEFEDAVAQCYDGVRSWLASGAGRGEDAFVAAALERLIVAQGAGYAGDELNRVRVHLASKFTGLDDHLAAKVDGLLIQVWALVAPAFGRGEAVSARAGLDAFAADLREAGCASLADAVTDLLTVRLDYRTHFHPRLRRQLDILSPQTKDPDTGQPRARIAVHPDADGAAELLRLVQEHGERAAHEAKNALLRDLSLPAQVLHAAIEQFDDAFIRGGDAEEEFIRYALERRDELWPTTFAQLDQAHRLFSGCRSALSASRAALSALKGGA